MGVNTYPATTTLLSILIVRRFKVGQIYYILYLFINKNKAIYKKLLVIQNATILYH